MPATDIVREIGITEQAFYNCKHKHGDMNISEAKRLKQLKAKNAKLKEFVAELSLDNNILKVVISKLVKHTAKRAEFEMIPKGLPCTKA